MDINVINFRNTLMNILLFILLLFASFFTGLQAEEPTKRATQAFEKWCQHYGKVYSSNEEKLYRFSVFSQNLQHIESHNSKDKLYKMGLNRFSDMTDEEFRSWISTAIPRPKPYPVDISSYLENNTIVPPHEWDWRKFGAVTDVKDQGWRCGSCWVHSSLAAIESGRFIDTGKLESLSAQEIVDCKKGCEGGELDAAYDYVHRRGVYKADDYPLASDRLEHSCNSPANHPKKVTIHNFTLTWGRTEEDLKVMVFKQPVTSGIDTSCVRWYDSGILTEDDKARRYEGGHAISIVGYGTRHGVDYWIIKNSWDRDWGEHGFMRVQRGKGLCGLGRHDILYPILHRPFVPHPSSSASQLLPFWLKIIGIISSIVNI